MNKKDFFWAIKASTLVHLAPIIIVGAGIAAVTLGPFHGLAKVMTIIMGALLLVRHWLRCGQHNHITQLRYCNGALMQVFDHGREPELVTLVGQQRILPWLIELEYRLENGCCEVWGIGRDAMHPEDFRQLKVFIKTHNARLVHSRLN